MMYEYKFVKVNLGGFMTLKPSFNYHEIVKANAKEGWRFVQIFTPPISEFGKTIYL